MFPSALRPPICPGPYAPAYPADPDATPGYGLLPWCDISVFADNAKAEYKNFKIAVKIKFEIILIKTSN